MRRWTMFLLAAVTGCGTEPVRFQPASARGSALHYELERDGRDGGDVKVWVAGRSEKPSVEVRFRIRNDGDDAIEFAIADTYAELAVGDQWTRSRPVKPRTGAFTIAPGRVEEVPLVFALPTDVDELEVNWTVRWSGGRMTRSSVFLAARDGPYAYDGPYYGMGMRYGTPYWPHRYWDDPFWP